MKAQRISRQLLPTGGCSRSLGVRLLSVFSVHERFGNEMLSMSAHAILHQLILAHLAAPLRPPAALHSARIWRIDRHRSIRPDAVVASELAPIERARSYGAHVTVLAATRLPAALDLAAADLDLDTRHSPAARALLQHSEKAGLHRGELLGRAVLVPLCAGCASLGGRILSDRERLSARRAGMRWYSPVCVASPSPSVALLAGRSAMGVGGGAAAADDSCELPQPENGHMLTANGGTVAAAKVLGAVGPPLARANQQRKRLSYRQRPARVVDSSRPPNFACI
jgi:hypothetical protein